MGILDELSSATGDKESNKKIAKRCLDTPALLHTLAEGLRTGAPKVGKDCVDIFAEVSRRQPEAVGDFVNDLLDASKQKQKIIARQALNTLAFITPVRPSEVFAQRDYLLERAREAGPPGLAAVAVLARLCRCSPNYRGKLLIHVLRLLQPQEEKDILKWVKALVPAVEGSADSVSRLEKALAPCRVQFSEATNKKLDRLLSKL